MYMVMYCQGMRHGFVYHRYIMPVSIHNKTLGPRDYVLKKDHMYMYMMYCTCTRIQWTKFITVFSFNYFHPICAGMHGIHVASLPVSEASLNDHRKNARRQPATCMAGVHTSTQPEGQQIVQYKLLFVHLNKVLDQEQSTSKVAHIRAKADWNRLELRVTIL